ncbi:MAG: hypothetical protein WD468_09510 [Pirellulales bacterium]
MRFSQVAPYLFLLFATLPKLASAAPRADGQLELEVVDGETGQPLAARVHLRSTRSRSIKLQLPGTSEYGDHFYVDGRLTLPLRVGQYTMEIEATPEYRTITSQPFDIERHADDSKKVELPRFCNLADEGWWAGDLDVARPPADLPLAMRAEGVNLVVDVAPPARAVSAAREQAARKPNDATAAALQPNAHFVIESNAILDQRAGGGLVIIDAQPPVDLSAATPYSPTSLSVIRDANKAGGHVIARTPFAWDLPVWLASSELDAIQLIHHHSLRNDVENTEQDGRPRDRSLFPGTSGNGRWSEAIYYHVLNCGLCIPPAAGSGTGTNGSPLGNNRVYVYCGDEFSSERWWEGLEAGRVFVTNGPLLRPMVQGKPPGYIFPLRQGDSLTLEVGLELATRVPVEYLQVIKNGRVEAEARLEDWKGKKGRLPPVVFDDSGWFLVRAVTNNPRNYQFASSGPYYVEVAGQPRISRRSVQFFLDWLDAAEERLGKLKEVSDSDRAALLAEQEQARQFFADLLARANAD